MIPLSRGRAVRLHWARSNHCIYGEYGVNIPNNEGKVCDAVIRNIEKLTGEARTHIRCPDKESGDTEVPKVDLRLILGAQEYAIEHTRIESFVNQIKMFDDN